MALVEGVKYGLSTPENSQNPTHKFNNYQQQSEVCAPNNSVNNGGGGGGNGKKSIIFVKLTDSALKAIEDYLRSQKTGDRATLQFLGNEGRINIPSSNHNGHSFDFSLSSNADTEGPQGSFECIQQSGSSSLESMGTVPYKMRIHANEDVYEATKLRFSALEQSRQQDCAKEIKPNNADIGRKVKTKLLRPSDPLPTNFSAHNKRSSLPQSSTNLTNNHNRVNNGYYTNHNHNTSLQSGRPPNHRLTTTDISDQIKHNYNATSGNAPPPRYGGSSSSGGDITRKPLKDRIIHLLAVKSYKKPELINRLTKEGLKQKDRKLVMVVLPSVSSMKGNEYFLKRGIWNDVNEYWPFYTEEERQVMKRRKPQNLTPPGSDCSIGSGTSGGSLSPPSSSGHSGSSPPSSFSTSHYDPLPSNINGMLSYNNANSGSHHLTKRPGDLETYDDIPSTKRQRISHIPREDVNNEKPEPVAVVEEKPNVVIDSINSKANGNAYVVDKVVCNSFLSKYTPIRTPEERARYKMDFNNEYKRYRDVHSVIEKVGNHFAQLQVKLQKEPKGTPAYEVIRDEIVNEYKQTKRNRRYVEAKKSFPELHDKLSHIKRMVEEYDRTHSSNSAGYGSQYENYSV
jgi:RNA polymerase II elongation factor ELL